MRKLIWLMFSLSLAALLIILCSTWVLALTDAEPPEPAYIQPGEEPITIDGSYQDWNIGTTNYFANMYLSADPTKEVLAKLYLRYDCNTGTIYALVLAQEGCDILTAAGDGEHFLKIDGAKLVEDISGNNGTPPDFMWINENISNGTAAGWEASATISEGSYRLDVHAQVDDGNEEQTAAVKDRDIPLKIDCGPVPPTPELPTIILIVLGLIGFGGYIYVRSRHRRIEVIDK